MVAVLMLAAAIATVGPAAEAGATAIPTANPRCHRPFSTTLLETEKVRMYTLPEESTAHPAHRDPPIAGSLVFACLESTGRSLLLDLPELSGEKDAYWVTVDSPTVTANGPLVAYAYTQYYLDTHETWVRVRNLNTGAVTRNCFVGGAMAPHRLPRVTDIVLSSDGTVGWTAEGEGPETTADQPPGCNPGA